MRYIILKSNISLKELKSRQEYLYDVFKVYTIPFCYNSYTELRSIPDNYGNVIFVNGHNNQVYKFLMKEKPKEHDIVMITCYQGLVKKINFADKNMFFTNTVTDILNGKEYGFDFEITNSELDLYNCPCTSIKDKINYSFERVD